MQLKLDKQLPAIYVEVVLPVPIPTTFTYSVPLDMQQYIQTGVRVLVEFGNRKLYTAIVAKVTDTPPTTYETKDVLDVLEDTPSVLPVQLKFWEWMASYYVATTGEVMQVALPSGLKLTSQSKIQIHPEFDILEHEEELSDRDIRFLRVIAQDGSIAYNQAGDILGLKQPYKIIKDLVERQAILIFEEVKDKYKPKVKTKIRLNPLYLEVEGSLDRLFSDLGEKKSKAKQEEVLLKYLSLVPVLNEPAQNEIGIEKAKLLKGGHIEVSPSALKTLIKNGVLEQFEQIISRFEEEEYTVYENEKIEITLSEAQRTAQEEVLLHFQQKDIVLLHGVTGSGKTEVYISMIQQVLESGSQVLFLLPEIVLTAQMVVRLRKVFGNALGVYHSKFSDNERVEVWQGVIEKRYQVIVGVRSSIFLPFDNLGLIVVDEEHESSYKQYDPAPRYNARDMALILAQMHQAKVVLGSATPSIESYYHALKGQYGFVQLTERYGNAQLPEIILADTKRERKKKTMKEDFTSVLLDEITEKINNNEQVILFQNRRGYAPYLMCEECNWVPSCDSCSVSLTYHIHRDELRCHYCGHREAVPKSCICCGSTKVRTVGIGTQKLEEDIKLMVPEARVQRMDLDSTRKKFSYQQIIRDFEDRHIDILVGTQMVSKGLDFDHVTLVGVFDIDRMLNFPDFRAYERAFQMLTQVSGRAGRRGKEGKVIIQTNTVKHPVLHKVINNDYRGFFYTEIAERQTYDYPPYTRLIKISVKCDDKEKADLGARYLAHELTKKLGTQRVLGPQEPIINKIRNWFLVDVLIKLERSKQVSPKKVKEIIKAEINKMNMDRQFRRVNVVVDVDPV